MVDIKTDINYSYIFNNLYDKDTIRYNKYVKKEWKFKEDNDEFNIISPFNKNQFNILNDDDSIDSEKHNIYNVINPYIEDDIYNNNDEFLCYSLKHILKWLNKTNNYILTQKQISDFKKLFYDILFYLYQRNKNNTNLKENAFNLLINDLEHYYLYHKSLFNFINDTVEDIINNSKNQNDNKFNIILDNQYNF